MPPQSQHSCCYHNDEEPALLEKASNELETLKPLKHAHELSPLPPNCFQLIMRGIAGNELCVDCGASSPDWASISYGTLICFRCSARHRSLGVQYSKVRSLRMDHFSHSEVLLLLEGGNDQLKSFFQRHGMDNEKNRNKRYLTKAAKFYREGINKHVCKLSDNVYRGRKMTRRLSDEEGRQKPHESRIESSSETARAG